MLRKTLAVWLLASLGCRAAADDPNTGLPPTAAGDDPPKKAVVYVVPVRDQIAKPILYILRRGLKEAIERKADVVLLDMDTPGGEAGTMLEIMEALDKFEGETITYVDNEAGSAGAIIAAVTDEIYFAPTGVMGAAELILATGQDVGEGLKRKMTSYINAKIRALSDSDPRRADVLKAMTTPDFELKIGETVIKPKGELLTLTAKEAVAPHGDPPTPLLAAGIAKDVDDLLLQKFGASGYAKVQMQVTWSEKVAQYLNAIGPVLMGLGMLCLFIEFKTPGFGFFGITGIVLLLIVFLGHYVAGFSGHEPILIFVLGLALVAVELFLFPGVAVLAVTGLALMFGSLVWAMADIWPNEPVEFSGDLFVRPLRDVGLGFALALALGVILARFLPKSWFWDRLVLSAAVNAAAQEAGVAPEAVTQAAALIGRRGVAATALRPSGQVDIAGRRYEAQVEVGVVNAGAMVEVTGHTDFSLTVKEVET